MVALLFLHFPQIFLHIVEKYKTSNLPPEGADVFRLYHLQMLDLQSACLLIDIPNESYESEVAIFHPQNSRGSVKLFRHMLANVNSTHKSNFQKNSLSLFRMGFLVVLNYSFALPHTLRQLEQRIR